jgi:hypothetical protein
MIFYFTDHLFEKVLTNLKAEKLFELNKKGCLSAAFFIL